MSGFTFAANLADIPVGGALAVSVDGVDLALVRDGDDVYAIGDECSHAAIPLSEGDVTTGAGACEIECWLHGSRFDVRTGKPVNLPAIEPIPTYPTALDDAATGVLVDLSKEQS